MAKAPAKSAILVIRPRRTIALAAGVLGFSALDKPDEYEEGKPIFKANIHYTPEGLTKLTDQAAATMAESLPALQKEADEKGLKIKNDDDVEVALVVPTIDPAKWVKQHKKDPKPGGKAPNLPFVVISTKATGKTKDGEEYLKVIKFWDRNNNELDAKKLRLGMGSVVEPIVYPNLVSRKLDDFLAKPSFQLVGLRVLSLVQWGGGGKGGAPAGAVDDAELAKIIGKAVESDDLSAFAQAADKPAPKPGEEHDPEDDIKDLF